MKYQTGWFLTSICFLALVTSAQAEWGIRHPLYQPLPKPEMPCCSKDPCCRLHGINRLRSSIQHHKGTCPHCGIPVEGPNCPHGCGAGPLRRLVDWWHGKKKGMESPSNPSVHWESNPVVIPSTPVAPSHQ